MDVLQVVVGLVVWAVFLLVLAVALYPVYANAWWERQKRRERVAAVSGVEILGYRRVTGNDGLPGIEIRYCKGGDPGAPFTVTSYLPDIWGAYTDRQAVPVGALFEPSVLAAPFRLASSQFIRVLENWVRENGGRATMFGSV